MRFPRRAAIASAHVLSLASSGFGVRRIRHAVSTRSQRMRASPRFRPAPRNFRRVRRSSCLRARQCGRSSLAPRVTTFWRSSCTMPRNQPRCEWRKALGRSWSSARRSPLRVATSGQSRLAGPQSAPHFLVKVQHDRDVVLRLPIFGLPRREQCQDSLAAGHDVEARQHAGVA